MATMILMVGTASPGGIAQVISGYSRDGIFEKWNVRLIQTHRPGSALQRLLVAVRGFALIVFLLLRHQVRLVHAHAAMRGSFWRKSVIVFICRWFRVPVVLHMHGSEMKGFYAAQTPWRQRLICRTLERASRVIVLSQGWADYIRSIAPASSISILPNYSPALPAAKKLDGETTGQPQKFVFLFLGALIDRKGIYELLPAFARIAQEFPNVELWLGGSGDDDRVKRLITENHMRNVTLLGCVGEARKHELLKAVDAFVLPSKNENLPMALIEAMSAALPIVTTSVGGIPEMLTHAQDALVIEPGNPELLYQAMREIRSNPDQSDTFGRNAFRRYEENYSIEVAIPKLERLYAEVALAT